MVSQFSLPYTNGLNLRFIVVPGSCVLGKWEIIMTGEELHQLIVGKWGFSFDVQLKRGQSKFWLQIMWRYLEQKSFPMTEQQYMEHLNAVGGYISAWESDEYVRQFIEQTSDRPRIGVAVRIPIELGSRSSEWLLDN